MPKQSPVSAAVNPEPLVIFAFGTLEGSTKKAKGIITAFSQACKSQSKLVLEGPGVLGLEVEENVKIAVKFIEDQINEKLKQGLPPPKEVCFGGFSRGAVTGIRIANAVKEKYPDLEFNIFALDPVAGTANKGDQHAKSVPSNVKNYVATYSDDKRFIMKGQGPSRIVLEDPTKTAATILRFPGKHSEVTRAAIDKNKNVKVTEAAELSWYLFHKFLTKHGVKFKNDKMPPLVTVEKSLNENGGKKKYIFDQQRSNELQNIDPRELLQLYAKMRTNSGYARSEKPRSKNDRPEDFVLDADFFLNQHERELFKQVYPVTFNYLFENNSANHRGEVVEKELSEIKNYSSAIFNHILTKKGVVKTDAIQFAENVISITDNSGTQYSLKPSGKNQAEFFKLRDEKPAGYDFLHRLEKQVIDGMTAYKRDRNEFKKNPFHKTATKIRESMRSIMNEVLSDEEKASKIITLLKEHQALLPVNDKLRNTIDKILMQNDFLQLLSVVKYKFQSIAMTTKYHGGNNINYYIDYMLAKFIQQTSAKNCLPITATNAERKHFAEFKIMVDNLHYLQKTNNDENIAALSNISKITQYAPEKIEETIDYLRIIRQFESGMVQATLLRSNPSTSKLSFAEKTKIISQINQGSYTSFENLNSLFAQIGFANIDHRTLRTIDKYIINQLELSELKNNTLKDIITSQPNIHIGKKIIYRLREELADIKSKFSKVLLRWKQDTNNIVLTNEQFIQAKGEEIWLGLENQLRNTNASDIVEQRDILVEQFSSIATHFAPLQDLTKNQRKHAANNNPDVILTDFKEWCEDKKSRPHTLISDFLELKQLVDKQQVAKPYINTLTVTPAVNEKLQALDSCSVDIAKLQSLSEQMSKQFDVYQDYLSHELARLQHELKKLIEKPKQKNIERKFAEIKLEIANLNANIPSHATLSQLQKTFDKPERNFKKESETLVIVTTNFAKIQRKSGTEFLSKKKQNATLKNQPQKDLSQTVAPEASNQTTLSFGKRK